MTTTLVIPDAHATPEVSNERFDVLGEMIMLLRPDNIVQIGDFMSLDSVSFHNRGRPLIQEGLRLADDINVGKDAYARMMAPLRKARKLSKKKKQKAYWPRMYWLNGNHEDRVMRYVETQPALDGLVDHNDLVGGLAGDKWTVVPYKAWISIEGTSFTHSPLNPKTGKPLGGKYVCARAAEFSQHTVVFGHTHMRNIMAVCRSDSQSPTGSHRVEGINVGCWLDHVPHYVQSVQSNLDWWEGLTMLTHTGVGTVDPAFYSIRRCYDMVSG